MANAETADELNQSPEEWQPLRRTIIIPEGANCKKKLLSIISQYRNKLRKVLLQFGIHISKINFTHWCLYIGNENTGIIKIISYH
jgi:hypothetical protein